jgi:transposase
MRGNRNDQPMMLAWIDVEARVPLDHPLRPIKKVADDALRALSDTLDRMYAQGGRRSIPPERLLKASLLIPLYSIRSERQLCEQLEYNLLFRWFLDMDPWEPVFDPTSFSKNRQRLLRHQVGQELFDEVVARGPRAWTALGRALHRGWDADRSGRQLQELQAQGRPAAAHDR